MDHQIRTIYAAAAKAQQENPTDCDILEPFLTELRAYRIPFALANLLDMEYFGCDGEYWREAYGFPNIGKTVKGLMVLQAGLLTFMADPLDHTPINGWGGH
jgi:hypothetical protein